MISRGLCDWFRAALLPGAALLVTGCASYHGYPDRYSDVSKDLAALATYFTTEKVADCERTKQVDCRDLIVNSMVRAIDLQFDDFRQQLFRSSGALNVGSDVAVLGLSAAGALVGGTTTKAILAAVSGAVTGTKGSIDKNMLFDKTVLVILGRMEAQRAEVQVSLVKGLKQRSWDAYPLSGALVDVEKYYTAGTIPAAINSINAQTGLDRKTAETELKTLR